jgi:catechol 2,3-dioxygenase-like lactoylglutathione lyase family enzyme
MGAQLHRVSMLVDDLDRAIAWFTDSVGFRLIEDVPSTATDGSDKRWVVVGGSTGGEIVLALPSTDEQRARLGSQTGDRVGWFLRVDDFDTQHRRMIDAGTTFLEPPRHEPYGTVAVFVDPWGNRWDLLGPPPG